jgi:hypothetical protein
VAKKFNHIGKYTAILCKNAKFQNLYLTPLEQHIWECPKLEGNPGSKNMHVKNTIFKDPKFWGLLGPQLASDKNAL